MHGEFDPDDNFAHAFHSQEELDDDAALASVVWQLLLLVNPGDEDGAMSQFAQWRDIAGGGDDMDVALDALREATDWKSAFHVGEGDVRGLVESLDELAARLGLRIDWGVDDPTDEEFLDAAEIDEILGIAFDRLREHHYTLWTREAGEGLHAGWIAHSRDDEAMRLISDVLGLQVRPAAR
jgi:hypothetical protein